MSLDDQGWRFLEALCGGPGKLRDFRELCFLREERVRVVLINEETVVCAVDNAELYEWLAQNRPCMCGNAAWLGDARTRVLTLWEVPVCLRYKLERPRSCRALMETILHFAMGHYLTTAHLNGEPVPPPPLVSQWKDDALQ